MLKREGRKENKDIGFKVCMDNVQLWLQTCITNEEEMFLTLTAVVSAASHAAVVGFYNYLLPLPLPCPQQTSQRVMALHLVG